MKALAAGLGLICATITVPSTFAADSCGFFAFAGAFPSFSQANDAANRLGGAAWGLDASDSPNAGNGLWVVAVGPGSRAEAEGWKRAYEAKGIRDAYVGERCFYGE